MINTIINIKPGKASLKKKPTDKAIIQEVDIKAMQFAEFIEEINMFGIVWNKFLDHRGWEWIQSK